jgi:nitrogen fixation NifU-like protein
MYSERLMTWCRGATHAGEPAEETHRGVAGEPGCGPYLILRFQVEEGQVRAARFRTYPCPVVTACAEATCALSEGRSLERLRLLTPAEIALLVGGVPEGKEHCPALAAEALARMAPVT